MGVCFAIASVRQAHDLLLRFCAAFAMTWLLRQELVVNKTKNTCLAIQGLLPIAERWVFAWPYIAMRCDRL